MSSHNLLPLIFIALFASGDSELFTALVDLEKLLNTEREIVQTLDKYLAVEEQRLAKIRWFREEYEKLYERANSDVQSFLSNPVNAYLLVKHLTADWKTAEDLILGYDSQALIRNITANQHDLQFPDDEDLNGAAIAIMRLQDTYKLNTSIIARGVIEGAKQSPELAAGDCYELGRQAYNAGDYYHTLLWMQEALVQLDEEQRETADRSEVMEYIAYSDYMQGEIKSALKMTYNLLELVPDHPRAAGNLKFYQDAMNESEAKKRGDDGTMSHEETYWREEEQKKSIKVEQTSYQKLCRGEKIMTVHRESELRCRYITNDRPSLLLQPVKEEELSLQPRVVVYYDVMSDNEIDVVKTLALPKLRRATVQNMRSGEMEAAAYRISKSGWLQDGEHPVIARISQRIEDITGLTLSTAEELQVVNYGIGGHYEPHFDFALKEEVNAFKYLGTANRIATWLNYMSDVDAGGATVFTQLGVIVKPRKGSAAFWYNLLRNGEGDFDTRHAACPVLAGSKWVANKWLHEYGQEFRRRCSLDPYE